MSSVRSVQKMPNIKCKQENHSNMPFQFICLNQKCIKYNNHLLCLHCCKELHTGHISNVKSLKQIIQVVKKEVNKQKLKSTTSEREFQCLRILLNGFYKCEFQEQLKRTSAQMLKILLNHSLNRFQSIFNEQLTQIHQNIKQFYQNKSTQSKFTSLKKYIRKQPITPVISFNENLDINQFIRQSPFQIRSLKNQMIVTAFASPSLSSYSQQSIYLKIKIENLTPNWMAIGLSIGQNKYQSDSKNHVMILSNGWLNNFGKFQKCDVGFNIGDVVSVKWDISLKKVQFECRGQKVCAKFERKWNQEVFLCVGMFYANNSVSILQ